ncbi:MAG: glycosyl hydrolase [Acidobacteria bacterium]|nr:glycosyl hydrolase [Acidobacteriota bacterium]
MRKHILIFGLILFLTGSGAAQADAATADTRLTASTFSGLEFRCIGPALMSGRIADIAVHPQDAATWYVAVGSGNVWKTVNAGTTWQPVFDDYGSYSIGCVTLDPQNPNVVWVGTGENVGGRHVGYGDGVYKSRDSGATWHNVGLKESEHIGRIVVDPTNSAVVFVAVQGPLWSSGGQRGLFRTQDGGRSWKNILSAGPYTGVNDVVMDPRDPNVLYASTHQRFRTVAALINGGPETAIYKSEDGGESWRKLTLGLPDEDMGRIGLAISPQQPDVVYATIELAWRKGGFWRSSDRGETWEKRSDYLSGGTGPHYYQEIFASPHQFDRVYQMDVQLHVTEDGGKTWRILGPETKHSDHHALAFDPGDREYLLVGTDGGLYESWDLGEHWRYIANLPVTQFYKVAVDNDEPFYNIYGGTQDNATQGGPSRTDNFNGIRNSDWFITIFADGHQPAVDPENPDIVYSEWQQGNLIRYDRRTGETVYIQPQPEPGDPAERWNWDSPVLISPHTPSRLYYASQRVWRSDDRGDSWTPISGDLTRGRERLKMPLMGRVWSFDAVWDLHAMSNFGSITSLAESPLQEGLLYAGTDDGRIQVTEDGGKTWRKIDQFPGIPENSFVNDIKADRFEVDSVYAAFDNHKQGDFQPYLLKSTDRGRTWVSLAGDLPSRHLVWRIVQDPVRPQLLFAGTEFGIFFTIDGGGRWITLEGGVPTIPFRDLAIQERENDLVGASFGRGFYVLDDYTPLRDMSEETLAEAAVLFPVRRTWWYIPRHTLGTPGKAFQGDAFFMAPNPPYGAVFTYYLGETLMTRKQQRRTAEKEVEKQGGDTPHPGWNALRQEAQEEDPAILLTVHDSDGNVVRHLTGPVTAGFHRVAWDLRYPPSTPPPYETEPFFMPSGGPLAAPGEYGVSLAKRVDGIVTDLQQTQSFSVAPLRNGTLPQQDPDRNEDFQRRVAELQRSVSGADAAISQGLKTLDLIKQALLNSTAADTSLHEEARVLEKRLLELREAIHGDAQPQGIGEPVPPSINRRLQVVLMGSAFSTYGPTPTHRRSYEIAHDEFAQVQAAVNQLLEVDLPALEQKLEAAGVPWTPGRPVPEIGR